MLCALIDAGSGGWLPLNLISHYTALGFVVSTALYRTLDLCPVASETEEGNHSRTAINEWPEPSEFGLLPLSLPAASRPRGRAVPGFPWQISLCSPPAHKMT